MTPAEEKELRAALDKLCAAARAARFDEFPIQDLSRLCDRLKSAQHRADPATQAALQEAKSVLLGLAEGYFPAYARGTGSALEWRF